MDENYNKTTQEIDVKTNEDLLKELMEKAKNVEFAETKQPLVKNTDELSRMSKEMTKIINEINGRNIENTMTSLKIEDEKRRLVPIESASKSRSFLLNLWSKLNGQEAKEKKEANTIQKQIDVLEGNISSNKTMDENDENKISEKMIQMIEKVRDLPIRDDGLSEYRGKDGTEILKEQKDRLIKKYDTFVKTEGNMPKPTIEQIYEFDNAINEINSYVTNAKSVQISKYKEEYENKREKLSSNMGLDKKLNLDYKELLAIKEIDPLQGTPLEKNQNTYILDTLSKKNEEVIDEKKEDESFLGGIASKVNTDKEYPLTKLEDRKPQRRDDVEQEQDQNRE